MVVTSQHLASQRSGADILKMGGNAIDAAAAVGYAQALANPFCGNIGDSGIGDSGFMTIHLADGTDTFINFHEAAPAAASAKMYLDAVGKVKKDTSLYSYLAVAIPSTVPGMETACEKYGKKYGKLSRQQLLAPAIKLAREGFVLTRADTGALDTTRARFKQDPESAKIFLRPDGTPLRSGDRLVQRDLANTLSAIAKDGTDAFYRRHRCIFYRGKIPQAVAGAAKQGGVF